MLIIGQYGILAIQSTMPNDMPLVGIKKPTIGDYLRSGSCTGEPRVRNMSYHRMSVRYWYRVYTITFV